MTWSQFFHSMRNGVSNRAAAITRRTNPQQPANRVASTQASPPARKIEAITKQQPPMETWDCYVIDASIFGLCVWLFVFLRHDRSSHIPLQSDHSTITLTLSAATLILRIFSQCTQEFGEPTVRPW